MSPATEHGTETETVGAAATKTAHVAGPQPSVANLHAVFPRLLLGLAAESMVSRCGGKRCGHKGRGDMREGL